MLTLYEADRVVITSPILSQTGLFVMLRETSMSSVVGLVGESEF
jgi:hypothetical protein